MSKVLRFLFGLLFCFLYLSPLVAGEVEKTATKSEQMHQAPFKAGDVAASEAMLGGGQRGDEGLKQLPHFDLPKPGLIGGLILSIFLWFTGIVIHLCLLTIIVVVIVRAVKRRKANGSALPTAESLFTMFDAIKKRLDDRYESVQVELKEIEKRRGKATVKSDA